MRTIVKMFAAPLLAVIMFGCEKDVQPETQLGFDNETLVAAPEAGTVKLIVRSNSSWKIVSEPESWYEFNITEGKDDGAVSVTCKTNPGEGSRSSEIVVKAGAVSKTVELVQLGTAPSIVLNGGEENMNLTPAGSELMTISLVTNVPLDDIEMSFEKLTGEEGDWITNILLTDTGISMKVLPNKDQERSARITLYYEDAYGRVAEAVITLTQSKDIYADAQLVSFAAVRALSPGVVTGDIMIEGTVISDGRSTNFMTETKTLSIQSATEGALLFEMANEADNNFARFDRVTLVLKDCEIEERVDVNLNDVTEDYTYRVIKGMTAAHIRSLESGQSFALPSIYMDEITDDMLFCMVELKDVEFSISHGCFTNWGEYYLNQGGDYLDKFKAFPQSIKDIKGNSMRLLTSPSCSYRRDGTNIPRGSGPLKGILVRENISNFGVGSSEISIRHLVRSDIGLHETDGFSTVLFEMSREVPLDAESISRYTAAQSGPIETGEGKIYTNQAVGFGATANANNNLIANCVGFFDLTPPGEGGTGQVQAAGLNFGGWIPNTTAWVISGVSTRSVPAGAMLSIQFAVNANNNGPVDFKIQYAIDGSGNDATWKDMGTYKAFGQLVTDYNLPTFIYAHMPYTFNFPAEAVGQDELAVRMLFVGTTNARGDNVSASSKAGVSRLSQLSIKYAE